MQKRIFSLLTVLLFSIQLCFAQTDTRTNNLDSYSSKIPVYVDQVGLQLIQANPSLNTGVANPETYILSPFDVISFQFEGNFSMMIKSAVINAQGDITIPQVGIIYLANKTIAEAKETLKNYAKVHFIKTDVSYLTLDLARSISVQVVGNVKTSTRYSLPGLTRLSTVLTQIIKAREVEQTKDLVESTNNASDFSLFSDKSQLFESTLRTPKLITEEFKVNEIVDGSFSLRDLKIVHSNGRTSTIDFIRYLKAGDISQNPVLQNEDRIEIATVSAWAARVSISGAVNSEGEFSFKSGESLEELIQLGSGLSVLADTTHAIIVSGDGDSQKVLRQNWSSVELKPNMRVIIPQKREQVQASIRIEGQINTPGLFPIKEGKSTLADLIELVGGFREDALLKGVFILRENTTPLEVNEKSEIDVLLKRTSDQYAQGLKYLDIELGIGQNRLYVDASNISKLNEIVLQDGDKIYVPRDKNMVVVFGQVNKPGVYSFVKNKSVDSYIELAGGVAIAGVKERVFIIKAGSKNWEKPQNTTLDSGDMIFIDRKPYEDYVTSQQLEMSKTQVKLSTWSLIISAISTTALLISVVLR